MNSFNIVRESRVIDGGSLRENRHKRTAMCSHNAVCVPMQASETMTFHRVVIFENLGSDVTLLLNMASSS